MKKTFGVSVALVGLLAVVAIGANTGAKPAPGGNIGSAPARVADGGNIGSSPAAAKVGGNVVSNQVTVAAVPTQGDDVGGKAKTSEIKAEASKAKTSEVKADSGRPEPYKTGYGIQGKTRTEQVQNADALSDPPKPETKAPETKAPDSKPTPE